MNSSSAKTRQNLPDALDLRFLLLLLLFLRRRRFDVRPLSNIFPFLFARILRAEHVLADVANRSLDCVSFEIHGRRGVFQKYSTRVVIALRGTVK